MAEKKKAPEEKINVLPCPHGLVQEAIALSQPEANKTCATVRAEGGDCVILEGLQGLKPVYKVCATPVNTGT